MLLTQNWAQKPSVLVQVLTARGRGGKISFFRAVKNGREKTPKPLRLRGFPVRYLFWSHNVSECYKKDTFIHSRNKMSSFESLTGNHTNWQRQGCQIIYRFPPSTITELL